MKGDTARYSIDFASVFLNLSAKGERNMNLEKLKTLARDLRKMPPRSPRERLGGFVIGARMLDKARADILGINGEYNYYPCGLGAYFWKFTGLDAGKFKDFVWPATEIFPLPSTEMLLPISSLLPPSRVENNSPEPAEFNLVTKTSGDPDPIVPAYSTAASVGCLTRLRTAELDRPLLALVQLLPPFVVFMTPLLTLA